MEISGRCEHRRFTSTLQIGHGMRILCEVVVNVQVVHTHCGSNSVGRVSAFQAECRRFESGLPLQPHLTPKIRPQNAKCTSCNICLMSLEAERLRLWRQIARRAYRTLNRGPLWCQDHPVDCRFRSAARWEARGTPWQTLKPPVRVPQTPSTCRIPTMPVPPVG